MDSTEFASQDLFLYMRRPNPFAEIYLASKFPVNECVDSIFYFLSSEFVSADFRTEFLGCPSKKKDHSAFLKLSYEIFKGRYEIYNLDFVALFHYAEHYNTMPQACQALFSTFHRIV